MITRKKLILFGLILVLALTPMTALAASKSDGKVTIYYPGGDIGCKAPIKSLGVPTDGKVFYRFYYIDDKSLVFLGGNQWNDGGNLTVFYPYDRVPAEIDQFGVAVAVFDGEKEMIYKTQAKWRCESPVKNN